MNQNIEVMQEHHKVNCLVYLPTLFVGQRSIPIRISIWVLLALLLAAIVWLLSHTTYLLPVLMVPFLLNENAPIDFALNALFLLVGGPLVIWLLVSMSRPNARAAAMVAATGLALIAWVAWFLQVIGGFFCFLLVLPFLVCLFRLRSSSNNPPHA